MYDLHLHLDGSASAEFLFHQAQKDHVVLPADTKEALLPFLSVEASCRSLNEYLQKFDLPLSVLQTEDAIEGCVYDLLSRLSALGLSGAEIRFAPQLHQQKGLPMEAVIEAAISGLKKGIREFPIKSGLILCCMRTPGGRDLNQNIVYQKNWEKNKQTVELAKHYLGKGVLALDLAGAEALYATDLFENLFRRAASLDVPFTIHAGEAAGAESIWKALGYGAARIGHGVRCVEDDRLVEALIQKQIPLEMCPTSNLQTKAVPDIIAHPILSLLDAGVCVTVNTDNMTVSNTTLPAEFELLTAKLGMTNKQKKQLMQNAEKASFLSL